MLREFDRPTTEQINNCFVNKLPGRIRYYLLDFKERCEELPERFSRGSLALYTKEEILDLLEYATDYDITQARICNHKEGE